MRVQARLLGLRDERVKAAGAKPARGGGEVPKAIGSGEGLQMRGASLGAARVVQAYSSLRGV